MLLVKKLLTADTLSRAPLPESERVTRNEVEEIEQYVEMIIENLPAGESCLEKYDDGVLQSEMAT